VIQNPSMSRGPQRDRTRTAPAMKPAGLPFGNLRYRRWLVYGGTSVFFLLTASELLALWWSLIAGEASWNGMRDRLSHPAIIAYHIGLLATVIWFGARTYFVLFAKTQPPRIGPIRRPPLWVFPPVLGILWAGVSSLVIAILWGGAS
jgi:fumarate reductase subunit C